MVKKTLGLLFNVWTLSALLVGALVLAIWVIGPLVAVGEWRPLDTVRSRSIVTGSLLMLIVASIAWRRWRARSGNEKLASQLAAAPPAAGAESADMAAIRQRFEAALHTLRSARFGTRAATGGLARRAQRWTGRYLYELPWYLIVGAPGSGKTTALRNAGLHFPLAARFGDEGVRGVSGTRDCQWWFTDRAVLIDTAGRFTTQDSDPGNDKAAWTGFLGLLKRSRPRRPLNGLLVTVSVSDLAKGAAERAQYAQKVQLRLEETQSQLGMSAPVYVLVTKCDLVAGFTETFAALDAATRATPWGFTFALSDAASWSDALLPEFDALQQRLADGLIDQLQQEPDRQRRTRIYAFPQQFGALRAPLEEFVREVFSPSPFGMAPTLRGVYFVSGTQEGTPIDRVLGAVARRYHLERAVLPPQHSSGRSYFLERLLTDVVFAEQGVAGADRRWDRRRRALVVAGYAAIALISAGAVAAWWLSWNNNRAHVDTVASRVDAVRRLVQQTPNRENSELVPLLDALNATREIAAASDRDAAVPWSMGLGLYQGRKLDGAAALAYERMLGDAVLPRLARRVEEELRSDEQPDSHYEALKCYLMMYDPEHFDAAALKAHFESDWDARQARELTTEQRQALSQHLDALLALGAAVSPREQDKALVKTMQARLATVSLPQRVYTRLRRQGLGAEFPDFTVVGAGGSNAQLVFTRASGLPLTSGVPGLFTYNGYHKGLQSVVEAATKQLADEQPWVLGIPAGDSRNVPALQQSSRLNDDVRRLYLNDYRDAWKTFIADIRLRPLTSIDQSLVAARVLAAPDTPLLPLMQKISHETTLLAGKDSSLAGRAGNAIGKVTEKVLGPSSRPVPAGAPGARIESIVDDEFAALRRFVTAPEGVKAPIEGAITRLGEVQQLLIAVDSAVKGGSAPPPSPLPTQMKAEAANAPEPVRSILDSLGSASSRGAALQLRADFSAQVRTQIGEFCNQALTGRYPFDAGGSRDVTPEDFALLFGPGGKFDQIQQKLARYIDTSTKPWSFRPVDGVLLGSDVGTLPQLQRAAAIRDTYFAGGAATPSMRLEFKPVEMDTALRLFTLDVDGQVVRYDHGPQIPQPVRWPGPRGSNVVRVMVEPAGGTGLVNDGPWALLRLFDRISIKPGSAPEKFRATFDIDGRKATFEVTAASVRSPFRLADLRSFTCPNGL